MRTNNGRNRFQKGSGVYTCNCCGRKTRSVGAGDCEHVGLCVECYEIAGIENQIQDGNFDGDNERKALIAEIRQLADSIRKAGGNPESEYLAA